MREIYNRRSVRKYIDKEIRNEDIKKILKAGMNAPTARNLKPYEFVVIKDKTTLEKLGSIKKNAYFAKDSNVTIIVLGKELSDYWQQDLGAVVQNMLLEATHLNIGSCWVGIAPNEDYENSIRKIVGIPSNIRIFSMVTLGYSMEDIVANNNFYEDKIHYEKY